MRDPFPRPRSPRLDVLRVALAAIVVSTLVASACTREEPAPPPSASGGPGRGRAEAREGSLPGGEHPQGPIEIAEERHLKNVRKLTAGGENAEAYWSWDGTRLVYQRRSGERTCDEIHVMSVDGTADAVVSSKGAHTCGYFLKPDASGERLLYSSTQSAGPDCPPPPDRSHGYVWPLHAGYDVWSSNADGTDARRLTTTPGYDAEATVGPDGRIVFTSVRDGDLELYLMQPDGTGATRLTSTPGYDGGAFFSPDGRSIIFRCRHPEGEELAEYRDLLSKDLVRPGKLEIWIMDADGRNARQVTSLGHAAFAPSFLHDGRRVIFASNHEDPRGRDFDLYVVGVDGTGLERVTWNDTFDGFPLLSPDGTKLAFCSNRGNAAEGETNVFVADWVD